MKTNELTGAQLDWSVAKCEGELDECGYYINDYTGAFMLEQGADIAAYCPSTLWNHGGPIIEREKISVWFVEKYADEVGKVMCKAEWYAEYREGRPYHSATGPTPLVAAMRWYVASKLGEYVDVPF